MISFSFEKLAALDKAPNMGLDEGNDFHSRDWVSPIVDLDSGPCEFQCVVKDVTGDWDYIAWVKACKVACAGEFYADFFELVGLRFVMLLFDELLIFSHISLSRLPYYLENQQIVILGPAVLLLLFP